MAVSSGLRGVAEEAGWLHSRGIEGVHSLVEGTGTTLIDVDGEALVSGWSRRGVRECRP